MIGIIVIGVSWLLLHFIEGKSPLALGFLPPLKRLKQFIVGFIVLGLVSGFFVYVEGMLRSAQWEMNSSISITAIIKSFLSQSKAALIEDLIFRGAVLYILISKIGAQKAVILSAIAFGIYHWFAYGLIGGDIMPMVSTFAITGALGYAWAYAFAKTKSIMLPLGLHIGSNFIPTLFLEKTPYGELLFKANFLTELSNTSNIAFVTAKAIIAPLAVILFVKWWVGREKP